MDTLLGYKYNGNEPIILDFFYLKKFQQKMAEMLGDFSIDGFSKVREVVDRWQTENIGMYTKDILFFSVRRTVIFIYWVGLLHERCFSMRYIWLQLNITMADEKYILRTKYFHFTWFSTRAFEITILKEPIYIWFEIRKKIILFSFIRNFAKSLFYFWLSIVWKIWDFKDSQIVFKCSECRLMLKEKKKGRKKKSPSHKTGSFSALSLSLSDNCSSFKLLSFLVPS